MPRGETSVMRRSPTYECVMSRSTAALVIAPLAILTGHVLVNRGWIPLDRKAPESRKHGNVEGEVTVEGYLRAETGPGWFTPANEPAKNFWFWIDLAAMARAHGIGKV